jgi:hypothetical protein
MVKLLPPPAGAAAANSAKLVVTLILYLPLGTRLWPFKANCAQGTGPSARAGACERVLSPGIYLASWCFRLRMWHVTPLV